jgi:hypothetical protein
MGHLFQSTRLLKEVRGAVNDVELVGGQKPPLGLTVQFQHLMIE